MGAWEPLKDLEDEELQELAARLPEAVLKSRGTSTTKKYLGAYKQWKSWAAAHDLPTFPAEMAHVALYLQYLKKSKGSKSAVEEAVHAIAWVHSMAGIPSPTFSPFIHSIVEGMKRELAMPVPNDCGNTEGY